MIRTLNIEIFSVIAGWLWWSFPILMNLQILWYILRAKMNPMKNILINSEIWTVVRPQVQQIEKDIIWVIWTKIDQRLKRDIASSNSKYAFIYFYEIFRYIHTYIHTYTRTHTHTHTHIYIYIYICVIFFMIIFLWFRSVFVCNILIYYKKII